MKKKRLLSLLLALVLTASMFSSLSALAAPRFSVTFYTDSSKKTVHETQQVAQGAHPKKPASNPAPYEANGYRYEYSGWYWTVDGSAMAFSFTNEDCEIWSNAAIYAGYTQYLASGYELIVVHAGGTEFITDTKTSISTLLKGYNGITSAYTRKMPNYQHSSEECETSGHRWDSGAVTQAATATAAGVKTFTCTVCGAVKEEPIARLTKKSNPLKLKVSSKTYQQNKLKKAASFRIGASGKGKISYTLNAAAKSAKLKVSKSGAVTVPKKCKKGTFKITVRAAGNSSYKAATKVVKIQVK